MDAVQTVDGTATDLEDDGAVGPGFDRDEVGEPVGPMPARPVGDQTAPPPDELVLRGDTQLSMFDPGGKKPTNATLTLRSKPIALEHGTTFKKGRRVRVEAVFVIDDSRDKDAVDKATGMVVDCTHKIGGFMEDVRIIEGA